MDDEQFAGVDKCGLYGKIPLSIIIQAITRLTPLLIKLESYSGDYSKTRYLKRFPVHRNRSKKKVSYSESEESPTAKSATQKKVLRPQTEIEKTRRSLTRIYASGLQGVVCNPMQPLVVFYSKL